MIGQQNDTVTVQAEPQPIVVDLAKAALLVVDMQNAFAHKGGYFDLVGLDITPIQGIIEPCRKIIDGAHARGIRIIYLQMGCSPDLSDKGPPDAPSSIKSRVLSMMKEHPEWKDRFYIYDTWGAEIIEELKPREGDIVVKKQKHDGFIGTNLDIVLRTFGARYLFFVGAATNICVESTLRHAFSLDYFPILISDAVSQMGSSVTQEATLLNVQSTFGWVTNAEDLLRAIRSIENERR
ncbi:MAG TPA: isochorismatase family cysteine hydrolase [Thermodesulfobacteriota bacterium]|nr:isochorismatase family cysteine hydrolase [Thermodesulfobacteriota bacterium]